MEVAQALHARRPPAQVGSGLTVHWNNGRGISADSAASLRVERSGFSEGGGRSAGGGEGAEDSVHEAAGFFGAVLMGQLDRLVDSCSDGDILKEEQLVGGEPKD